MKIYKVLAIAICTFLTLQCRAANDIASWDLTLDNKKIVFTYNYLRRISEINDDNNNRYRARVLLRAIHDSSVQSILKKNPNEIIVLNRLQGTLGNKPTLFKDSSTGIITKEYAEWLVSDAWEFNPEEINLVVWSGVNTRKETKLDKDFYATYFLAAAQAMYSERCVIFNVEGGGKRWLDLNFNPVMFDALFGTGMIHNDFSWLPNLHESLENQDLMFSLDKFQSFVFWLNDHKFNNTYLRRAFYELASLKSVDNSDEHKKKEQLDSIRDIIFKIVDLEKSAHLIEVTTSEDTLNFFMFKYGAKDATTSVSKEHRFILAFASSTAYMNEEGKPLSAELFAELRAAVPVDFQEYISNDFCNNLVGQYLVR